MAFPAVDTTHRIDLDTLDRHGIRAVGGYDPTRGDLRPTWKTMLPAYVHELTAAGYGVFDVLETTAAQARGSEEAGHSHATIAAAYADALGKPEDRLIMFAVDQDAPLAAVRPYAQGFHAGALTAGRGAGAYCGAQLGEQLVDLGLIVAYWKTGSRSFDHGVAPTHADIIQHTTAAIPGTDDDTVMNEGTRMIWWGIKPAPPAPTWHGIAFPGEAPSDDPHTNAVWKFLMIVGGYGRFKHANDTELETFGSASVNEVKRLQHDHDVIMFLGGHADPADYWGHYVDGVGTWTGRAGPETWKFLNWLVANLKARG